jgi:hypothetical protein
MAIHREARKFNSAELNIWPSRGAKTVNISEILQLANLIGPRQLTELITNLSISRGVRTATMQSVSYF